MKILDKFKQYSNVIPLKAHKDVESLSWQEKAQRDGVFIENAEEVARRRAAAPVCDFVKESRAHSKALAIGGQRKRKAKSLKGPRTKERWSVQDQEWLRQAVAEGLRSEEIADYLGRSKRAIHRAIQRFGFRFQRYN